MEAAFEGLVNMLHKDSKDENDEVWLRSTTQKVRNSYRLSSQWRQKGNTKEGRKV